MFSPTHVVLKARQRVSSILSKMCKHPLKTEERGATGTQEASLTALRSEMVPFGWLESRVNQ